MSGDFVWIGLRREKLWSDGSSSLFRHWANGQPDGPVQCATTDFLDSGQWTDEHCSLSFPFICYTATPLNAGSFRSTGQNETSITLQWSKVNNVSYILQLNGAETNISAPVGDGPVTHTVSSLTAGTEYTFTLFSVFETVRSSGVNITAVTAPLNAGSLRSTGQNETSITLQWSKVNNVTYILQLNGAETNISAPDGDGPVTHTVSSLTAGTEYTFTLFSVFETIRSSGVNITAVTAPQNAGSFRSTGQNETSITLQWSKVNNVSYILQLNGAETNISAPDGDGPVTHTVSSLTAGTEYTFTLFSVFETVRSSGVNITAVTAPQNAGSFRSTGQNETSITLQWSKVNNVSYILQLNGAETNISAPDGDGPVTHTVSSLTAGTEYTFTLFSVFETVRSSGVNITAVTAPLNAGSFRSTGQNETSITLQWSKVNNVSYILQLNGAETNISAPDGDGPVTHTVSSLTAGTEYTFTLFSVFETVRSSGVNITAVTAPLNAGSFRSTGQNETSITLQWSKVNNVSYILQLNGAETNISAPDGDGPVTHTVSSLTAGTEYTFTLFSVFETVRSSGVNITAVTAPLNAGSFRSTGQNETSITLQWSKVTNVSYILQLNDAETNISAPDGDGPVTHTVSSLTAGTEYTFTLFSVFETIRSSGVNITAVTAPLNAGSFKSTGQNETSITLQWSKVNNVSYILQLNGAETNISAPDGDGPVTHTVSSLTAGTEYTFTLFSVFETIRSSGVNITAVTAPLNAGSFRSTGQNETSITLQWSKVNNVSYILQLNGVETNISAPDGDGPVTHTVSSLTAGTEYTFTLFSVFETVRSSGVNITAVTVSAPLNAGSFRSTGQDETSITLQWSKVNNVSYILQLNGAETNISAPDGDGPVTHTVSSLTAGTEYTFTLFSVFETVRSSGVNITAVTAPLNAGSFRSTGQDETSITLQWSKVNNVSYILQLNGAETNISAPDGDGPVTHTVSSLTVGTEYTFTLFSVFETVRSSGVNITAVTGKTIFFIIIH
ncbi:receptor-type tyrosine-protein phosphatase H-like [Centropristis striata]|uniref:receptor-type tyrosine-protein phosphatase H-like n=1 Tax=Centropristis striata TaxID=184440 RepID=UPI0027E1E70E|nr:receptor-type tyrosine-protein phosphatase H-like [Centropristis striata]